MRRLILALGLALFLGACGDGSDEVGAPDESTSTVDGRAPTLSDLTGVWLQVEDPGELGRLVQFYSDRIFASDAEGQLGTDPEIRARWDLEGDAISFTGLESGSCAEGGQWAWRATVIEDGRMDVVHTAPAVEGCSAPVDTEWTLLRVTPRPNVAIREIAVPKGAEGQPPIAEDLPGIWMPVEASGLLVRLSEDGSFAVDSSGFIAPNPDASVLGNYGLDGSTVTFDISGGHACTAPDSWTWDASLAEDGLLNVVHVEEAQGQCQQDPGLEWTLVRLSPSSAVTEALGAEQ